MKIALRFSDEHEAELLARRLSELTSGLDISIQCGDCKNSEYGDFDVTADEEKLEEYETVSALLTSFLKDYREKYNRPFASFSRCGEKAFSGKIIGVRSYYGGTGVSVVTTSLARAIAAKGMGNVMVISVQRNFTPSRYMSFVRESRKSPLYLSYLLKYDEKSISESMLSEDKSGVYYAEVKDKPEILAEKLIEEKIADIVFIDFGTESTVGSNINITIFNEKDMRTAFFEKNFNIEAENEYFVLNKSECSGVTGRILKLPYEPGSFTISEYDENKIKIGVDTMFTLAVKNAADVIWNDLIGS